MKITPEFARIHAHICGDGYICTGKSKRSKKELLDHPRKNLIRNRYYVRYVNTNNVLANQFVEDVKTFFGRKVVKLKKFEYDVSGKWIYDILKGNGVLKSHNFFIPLFITKSEEIIKKEWLKAFFDDEAYIYRKVIYLTIVNKKAILQIKQLLSELRIDSKFYGPYFSKNPNHRASYRIAIRGNSVLKFRENVGFSHPDKKIKLNFICDKIMVGTLGLSG